MGEPQERSKYSSSSSSSSLEAGCEELQGLEHAPPFWRNPKGKRLSKQLSMCETRRDIAWEKRRRQILRQERKKNGIADTDDLTDEDLNELKGCIELGFGFNEEEGQRLCSTLPALDLYFAVNRQYYTSPVSTPSSARGSTSTTPGSARGSTGCLVNVGSSTSLGSMSSSFSSPRTSDSDSWKICSPGDDPQQVKTKLRHWAQAVACSVMQSHP